MAGLEAHVSMPQQAVQGGIDARTYIGQPADVQASGPIGTPPDTLVTLPGVQAIDRTPRTGFVTGFTAGAAHIPQVQASTETNGPGSEGFGFQAPRAMEGQQADGEAVQRRGTAVTLPPSEAVSRSLESGDLVPGRHAAVVHPDGAVTIEPVQAEAESEPEGTPEIRVINARRGTFGVLNPEGETEVLELPYTQAAMLVHILKNEPPHEMIGRNNLALSPSNYRLGYDIGNLARAVNDLSRRDTFKINYAGSSTTIQGLTHHPAEPRLLDRPAVEDSPPVEAVAAPEPVQAEPPVEEEPPAPQAIEQVGPAVLGVYTMRHGDGSQSAVVVPVEQRSSLLLLRRHPNEDVTVGALERVAGEDAVAHVTNLRRTFNDENERISVTRDEQGIPVSFRYNAGVEMPEQPGPEQDIPRLMELYAQHRPGPGDIDKEIAWTAAMHALERSEAINNEVDHKGWLTDHTLIAEGVRSMYSDIQMGYIADGSEMSPWGIHMLLGVTHTTSVAIYNKLQGIGIISASDKGRPGRIDAKYTIRPDETA